MRSLTCSSAGPSVLLPFISSLSPHVAMNTTVLPGFALPPCRSFSPAHHLITDIQTYSTSIPAVITHPSFSNISSSLAMLSAQAKEGISYAIQNSWSRTTLRRYTGAIQQYIDFCIAEKIPDSLCFPVDEFVFCAFAASSAGKHADSTPRARVSAIKAWHIAHNMEWRGSSRLRYVLSGVDNLSPASSRHPPRPPINLKMLTELVTHLDLNTPLDAAMAACTVIAFWGQCRLGELLPPTLSSLSSAPLPLRSDLGKPVWNSSQLYTLHLPRTKSQHHGEDIMLVSQHNPIDPISLLNNHLLVNPVPSNRPIFSFSSPDRLPVLTKPVFLQRCNIIWRSLGYPHTTGHSFHIGGTMELLVSGIPPEVVKATGRWSSDSFFRYWCSLDDIAHIHVCKLKPYKLRHKRYSHRRLTPVWG